MPVFDKASAGPKSGSLPREPEFYIPCPAGIKDKDAFGFVISGESMYPRYRTGDIVVCSRKVDISTEDDVVVSLAWGEILCKIWRELKTSVRLESWNKSFDPMEVSKKDIKDKVKVVGQIWGSLVEGQKRKDL